ncbi:DUF892 family protein [Hansschlegelia beijingensis]|uniref:DUF892 family protein n=1 Tax=Hansschlegelia beijingensis TaxID=1133344 RepID=UPI0016116E4E
MGHCSRFVLAESIVAKRRLFLDTLKDIAHGEKQIPSRPRQMSTSEGADELRQLLERHREETGGEVRRAPTAAPCLVGQGQRSLPSIA